MMRNKKDQAKYGFPTKLGGYLVTGRVIRFGEIGDVLKDGVSCRMAEPGSSEALPKSLSWYKEEERSGKADRLLTRNEFSYIEQSKRTLAFMQEVTCV